MKKTNNSLNYFEKKEKIPSKIFYHYASLQALYDIVDSKNIRLMNLKSSNDKSELFYKPEMFIKDVSSVCEAGNIEPENVQIKNSLLINRDTFLKATKEKRESYAFCLSSKKDNLTHWDRYADSCRGVCIGFNYSALEVYFKRKNAEIFGGSLLDIGKIIYSQEEIYDIIREGLFKGVSWLRQLKSNIDFNDDEEFVKETGFIALMSIYSRIMKFSKKSSFIDEDEVRIYYDSSDYSSCLKIIDSFKSQIDTDFYKSQRNTFIDVVKDLDLQTECFTMTKSGIRSYRNLCLKSIWGSGVIPEIILGPMCIQNKKELQSFLKCKGLEGTKIKISSVPIR